MVADRWAVGGFLKGQRVTPGGFAKRETESLLIGPEVTWYVSSAEAGSTFFRAGVGYTRYRDEFSFARGGLEIQEITSGQGVGIQGSVGYAVAIADRISFEIGLQSSLSWIWAEKRVGVQMIRTDEELTLGSVAFLFGFKALL